jgi:hypothetical protein
MDKQTGKSARPGTAKRSNPVDVDGVAVEKVARLNLAIADRDIESTAAFSRAVTNGPPLVFRTIILVKVHPVAVKSPPL